VKIEVGDIVDTQVNENVIVVDIKKNGEHEYSCPVDVVFYKKDGDEMAYSTRLDWCTLVKKGEKKMKTYTGFEAIERMKTNWITLSKGKAFVMWKIIEGKAMKRTSDNFTPRESELQLNEIMANEFIDYVEPLKYKVGDEVWVKGKVVQVDERPGEMPYHIDFGDECTAWFEENEVKGIDE